MTQALTTETVRRIEARVEQLIAAGQYTGALQMLEVRFAQLDPPVTLLGPYVLCLAACGQSDRATQIAARAVETLSAMPRSDYRDKVLMLVAASVRMGERFAEAKQPTTTDALWR